MIKMSIAIASLFILNFSCYAGDVQNGEAALNNKQYAEAINYFTSACDAGEAEGCTNLANQYVNFVYLPYDAAKANQLYVKACELKSATGCYMLGTSYNVGMFGVKKDSKKAEEFYNQSCQLGSGAGCFQVGAFFDIAKNHKKAIQFYTLSCSLGNAEGCKQLKH